MRGRSCNEIQAKQGGIFGNGGLYVAKPRHGPRIRAARSVGVRRIQYPVPNKEGLTAIVSCQPFSARATPIGCPLLSTSGNRNQLSDASVVSADHGTIGCATRLDTCENGALKIGTSPSSGSPSSSRSWSCSGNGSAGFHGKAKSGLSIPL